MSDRIIKIIDAKGVYPEALDQPILEQKLYREGRYRQLPSSEMVFVFGSNEAGIHGAGAARHALLHRKAQMGVSFGPTGQCFAIPTKDQTVSRTLPLMDIKAYVEHFLKYARRNERDQIFQVTCIGCGLAGLKHEDIAPMFSRAPVSCLFDTQWHPYLPDTAKFWGTF